MIDFNITNNNNNNNNLTTLALNKTNDLLHNITNNLYNNTRHHHHFHQHQHHHLLQQSQQQNDSLHYNGGMFDILSTSEASSSLSPLITTTTSAATSLISPADIVFDFETNISPLFNSSNSFINETKSECTDFYNPSARFVLFEFWISGVVLNLVGILGILGNILSMVILSRPQMRSSINYLLIGLARCDTVLIITSMLLFGIPSIYPYTGYLFYYYYYIYPNISPLAFPIAMAAQTASVYMTFTVTLERYVAVCHPLRARALCTYGRAKIYFIVCIVLAVLYNVPRFWEVIVITEKSFLDETEVIYCVIASPLRYNKQYIKIYIHWCYLIFIYIIPFFSLAVLNCLIYRQVQIANRERQRLSRTERREIGLATMLLCVVVVFFVFNFLALYTNILEAFYNEINDYLVRSSNLLVTINSSANFIIYVIFGEKFKRIFLLLFCKGRISRDTPDLIHYESSISNENNGNRSSGRFSRHGTQRSITTRNGVTTSVRITKIKRNRAPSPGPCVYYPARELQRSATTILTPSSSIHCDCYNSKNNGIMTSGF